MNATFKRFKNTTYFVSPKGEVYNEYSGTRLKPFLNNGYLAVDIFADTVRTRVLVHRMVAMTFLDGIEGKDYVNHIDGNRMNNMLSNLEWCTPSENSKHAVAAGLSPVGSSKTLAKLTENDVRAIQDLLESGVKDFELAKEFGVTSGVISSIRLGKTWKHVSGRTFEASGPNPVKKLCAEDIPEIRLKILAGDSDAVIGRLYCVARGTINQIRQGKTWRNY